MSKIIFIIISIIVVFLLVLAVYTIYTPNSEKQEAVTESTETSAATTSSPETAATTTEVETLSTPIETTVVETTQTTTEDTSMNLPTLRLVIYEGPVIIQDSDMCYFRVQAIATGEPYPSIKFSKDDSNGAWGRNIAQVNLKNGESYNLIVTATNSAGNTTKNIVLTWSQ